ncbi:MAG: hypothetical protein ACAI44_03500 [Candidatus Sericytochromatia bacterium]
MPQTVHLHTLLEEISDVEVSIKVYLPDGMILLINDPEDHDVTGGGLWIKASDRELLFNDIPFFISDKRAKKKKTGFV